MNFLEYFKTYYGHNQIQVDSISQREFGIGIDKKINYRHKSFSNQRELQNFLVNEPPRFISHSVGKFEFPWSQPMEKKHLLGADVVFDLDAKPEEGHNSIFCSNCVERARNDTVKLLEHFLFPRFGLSHNDVLVVFSGSKGFHVHVRTPAVQQLSSTSRRFLVDYITGKELSVESLVHKRRVRDRTFSLAGPSIHSSGWQKHFFDAALKIIEQPTFLPKRKAAYLSDNKQRVVDLLSTGNWDFFYDCPDALADILKSTVDEHGVQVDSPVTFDVHRLIRVPGTLHGDTGLIARPISLNELPRFSATRDAAAFKGRVKVTLKESGKVPFAGEEVELKQGENDVLLSLGVLLACRGMV